MWVTCCPQLFLFITSSLLFIFKHLASQPFLIVFTWHEVFASLLFADVSAEQPFAHFHSFPASLEYSSEHLFPFHKFHISPVVVSGWGLGWLLIGCLLFLSVVCCRLWVVCCLLTVSCLLMVVVCCLSAVAWWLCHQVGWQTASQVWPSPNRWPASFPSTLSSSVAVLRPTSVRFQTENLWNPLVISSLNCVKK